MEEKNHPDVEYQIGSDHHRRVLNSFQEAAALALRIGMSQGKANIDVIIWSEKGAKHYGGDDALERYREDPDASVFERFEISVNNVGRVP